MAPKTIFISHSTQDDAQVDRIADAFERAGFEVWVDHRNGITPGTPSWDKAIRQAIDKADVGLFVMSEAALASEICGSECLLVRELDDPLYVLKLEAVKPANVWLYIKQIQYADLTQNFDAGIEAVIRTLNGETVENAPQAVHSKFTGESTLRQYLPYLFLSPMHGREDDLRRLTDSLNGVVQVTGTGGLGKSRLVAEVALKHTEGAVWYRCSPVSTPADLLSLLIEHLRLTRDSTEQDVLSQLQLRPRTLIVIDNAEAVQPAQQATYIALIARLQTAGAHVVLTSRVRWEQIRPLKEITPVALDEDSASAIAKDFASTQAILLTENEVQTLARAARLYPRLIEWAVGQVSKRPFERVLTQLRELKSKGVQEALDEMIRSSLEQMSRQEGSAAEPLLLRLVACQGTFDYEAAVALKPADMDADGLDDALDTLQAWRFVRYERGEERYSVDDMVRLALPAPDAITQQVHFDHYHSLHSDYDANQAYADDGSMLRHALLTSDWPNIQTALAWGFTHEAEKTVDWVWALQHFMMLRHTSAEQLDLLHEALSVAQNIGYQRGIANCLKALGDVLYMRDEYAVAVERYEQALPLYRTIGDRLGEANSLRVLGDVHLSRNEYAAAVERYEQALPLYRTIGARLGEANCLQALGDVQRMKNEYAEAVERYEQALPLYRTIGARLGEANCLKVLGDVHYMRDEYGEAVERYEQALPLYRTIGDRLGEANCLQALGDVHYMRDEYGEAVERYEQALPLYRTIGSRLGEANCLQSLGDVHRMKNEYAEAVGRYEQALCLYRTIGDRLGEANCLKALGDVQRMKNEYAEAIEYYQQALELGQQIGEFASQLNSLKGLAYTFHFQNNLTKACHYANALLTLADGHPFFKDHPIVQGWRKTFASWGCDDL